MDVELEPEDGYEVERILKWRRVKVGRRMTREFLVTWRDYPLDKAQWISRVKLSRQSTNARPHQTGSSN